MKTHYSTSLERPTPKPLERSVEPKLCAEQREMYKELAALFRALTNLVSTGKDLMAKAAYEKVKTK